MTAKHTPGPWRAEAWNTGKVAVVSDSMDVGGDDDWIVAAFPSVSERNWADARLIAAAPDLLAVLSEITERDKTREEAADWYRRALAVIAKAKGSV